ncbi:helix-turn-helix domain-containing protein [Mycobacterium sp. Aquia_213]|uniref:helix-turn-helix domain-containing protein n=1 Tax=Mycobacterium sp. Aquia_213 TaxID=2991728 RepID=UPI0022713273|nr:helix-turn-helix domain-containing protein [Mycobacterium sp. Aquia_213]WAC90228.1 helix-turn-helix domain-containing protein [Mycobacterium sp. Aquia_213]
MNPAQTVQLINLISKKRTECGLSVAEVARRAHLDVGAVWRIEQGMIATPKAESLKAIGSVLGIPSIDLFTIVGWIRAEDLPGVAVYFHAKYPALPDEAIHAIDSHAVAVAKDYGVNVDAPEGGTRDGNQGRREEG